MIEEYEITLQPDQKWHDALAFYTGNFNPQKLKLEIGVIQNNSRHSVSSNDSSK